MTDRPTARPLLERIFQVKPTEWPVLLRLWGCFFLLSCGLEVARLAAEALFISRAGVRWLPSLFVFQALANATAAAVYATLATRWSSRRVFVALMVGFGAAMCGTAAAVAAAPGFWAYGVLYGCAEVGATLLKIHWGVYILELYRPGSAARLFPFLYTGAALGRSAGGALVREGAALAGLPWLTCLSLAACIALALAALQSAARKARRIAEGATADPDAGPGPASVDGQHRPEKRPEAPDQPFRKEAKSAGGATGEPGFAKSAASMAQPLAFAKRREQTSEFDLQRTEEWTKSPQAELPEWTTCDLYAQGWIQRLRRTLSKCLRSELLQALSVATVLMVLIRYGTRYSYLVVFRNHLEEQALAQLLGTYSMIANLAGLLLQLVVVPRILRRFGIQFANLAYALGLTAGLGVLMISGQVWAGLAARFMDLEFKAAVKTPAAPIFYFGVPAEQRAEARAFILGAVVPGATILGGVILQLTRPYLPFDTMIAAGLFLGLGYVLAAHWQNRAYARAVRHSARPAG